MDSLPITQLQRHQIRRNRCMLGRRQEFMTFRRRTFLRRKSVRLHNYAESVKVNNHFNSKGNLTTMHKCASVNFLWKLKHLVMRVGSGEQGGCGPTGFSCMILIKQREACAIFGLIFSVAHSHPPPEIFFCRRSCTLIKENLSEK